MEDPKQDHSLDGGNRSLIQSAMTGSVAEAAARGAGRKAYLSGLWLAAMGTLLSVGDPSDVAALLVDRALSIKGQGRNADAPIVRLDEAARERRVREAGIVALVVSERVRTLAEDDGRNETFPEDFLDAALAILLATWGPAHLRRAIAEQVGAFESGHYAPILPGEPSVTNQPPKPAAPANIVAVPVVTPVAPLPVRPPRGADVHVDSELLATGRGAYAVAMNLDTGDRRETREICGTAADRTGRESAITGLLEALVALGPSIQGDRIRVSTPVEAVYRALSSGDGPGLRLLHEAPLWETVDRLAAGMDIEWCLRRAGTGSDLAQRCDRMLRSRSAEAEREAMAAA